MQNPIRAIVIDDEKQAREGIKLLLEKEPNVQLVALCQNGLEAIESIHELKPELLFLDIQMPGINGFEVLNSIDQDLLPAVIFTTAYDQFALEAFNAHAIDYLLKPFTNTRFFESVEHAKAILQNTLPNQKKTELASLLSYYFREQPGGNYLIEDHYIGRIAHSERLAIKSDGKIHFVRLTDIHYLEGYDSYIKIHTNERMFVVKDTLKSMEQKLPSQTFVRIHKSFIVNMDFVKTLEPHFNKDFYVHLSSGKRLKGSRNFRNRLTW